MPNKNLRDRAPNLTDENIEHIVLLLDRWNQTKLTWDLLIAQIQKQFKVRYTRQALDRHARISDAFQARKKLLSGPDRPKMPIDARITALMAENARLKRENNNLLEQFRRWLYNCSRLNLNLMEEDWRDHREALRKSLDKELPPANRQATKGTPTIEPKRRVSRILCK